MPWPYPIARPLTLSRSAHDRTAERRGDDAWLAERWDDPATRVVVVGGGRAPVVDGRLATVPAPEAPEGERALLGVAEDGTAYGAVLLPGPPAHPAAAGLREVGALLDDLDAGLLVHAVALANWHATHRHCPRCGAATELAAAGHVRRCPRDGSEHYPRTDPAMIVAVVDDAERTLLARQAAWPPGRFSTVAGFVEPGESLEACVVREVREETGVEVGEVVYAGSQPWPFPASLMLGCYARATSPELRPDGEEIAEASWFTRAELLAGLEAGTLGIAPPVSIARRLLEGWYGGPLPDGGSWRPARE